MSRKDRKFKRFFRQTLGDLQKKKKKKKKVFAKIQSDFSAEIQNSNVFSAQNQVISKKKTKKTKKRSSPKFKAIFLPKFRNFKRFRGGSFRMGGAIFNFSQKIGLKSTKNMRFCILHKPMGGARAPPPPPGYATAQNINCMGSVMLRTLRFHAQSICVALVLVKHKSILCLEIYSSKWLGYIRQRVGSS